MTVHSVQAVGLKLRPPPPLRLGAQPLGKPVPRRNVTLHLEARGSQWRRLYIRRATSTISYQYPGADDERAYFIARGLTRRRVSILLPGESARVHKRTRVRESRTCAQTNVRLWTRAHAQTNVRLMTFYLRYVYVTPKTYTTYM